MTVVGHCVDRLPVDSVFGSPEEASRFFEKWVVGLLGDAGYCARFDGLEFAVQDLVDSAAGGGGGAVALF